MQSLGSRRMLIGGMLVALALLSLPASATHAASQPNPNTPIIVAEDVTTQAACLRSVDGGPEQACPAGSVMYVSETTYAQVKAKGIRFWTLKTSNYAQDSNRVLAQAAAVWRAQHPVTIQACATAARDVRQSYLYVPSDPNSTRIGFHLTYNRLADCSAKVVRDENRIQSVGTSADAGHNPVTVNWDASCVNGGNNCNHRGIFVNAAWTGLFNEQDSVVGREYRNISLSDSSCFVGGRRCGNPYGVFFFD